MTKYIVTFTATYSIELEAADEDEASEAAVKRVQTEGLDPEAVFIHSDDIIEVGEAD